MKSKNPQKETSAFSDLTKELEKEKRKSKLFFLVGAPLLLCLLLSFLMFGPIEVPILSQIRSNVLGDTNSEQRVEEKNDTIDDTEEEIYEEEEVVESEDIPEEVVVKKEEAPTTVKPKPKAQPQPIEEPPTDPYAEFSCPYNTVQLYAEDYCKNLQDSAEAKDYSDYWFNSAMSCEIGNTSCYDQKYGFYEEWKEKSEDYYSEAIKYRNLMLGCNFDPKELPTIENACFK